MKFFICLFFSLITTNFCFCQANVIFKEYKEDSLIIKYTGSPTNKENKSDYIVEKLSKNIPKDINLTHYTFSFSYKVIITKTGKTSKDGGKIFSASIEASNKKCTGDVYYKSFSIANQLSPSAFDFTLLIEDVRNNTLTPIPFVIPIKYGFGKKENIEFRDDATDSIAKIKLTNKIFYYNDSIITLFNNRIQLIDDYYNSASIISSAFEKLKFINLDNAEIVKVYEINLKEVEATITELTNKNFPDQLNLSENDPINFISKFNQLDQKAKNLRLLINQMLNNLDEVFYNKGIEYLTKSDTASALNYLDKTTIANPNYYRAFYQLAKIYFDQKKYDKAFPLITTITTKLNPDQIYFKQTIQLGYDIYSIYISNANDLINLEKHHEALEILGKLKSFCSSTPAIVCSDDIQKDISKAINGIYMSFIIVSQKAIEKEILNIGEIYTIKAKEYQQSNSTEIPSSADADGLLNQLVNKLTINGLKLNAEQKYDTALVLLKKAYDLCSRFPEIKCNDKVLTQLSQSKNGIYKSIITKAGQCIQKNEPQQAEKLIAEAILYQKDNAIEITKLKSVDTLTALLEKIYYDQYIKEGIASLYNNDGIKALEAFGEARKIENIFTIKRNPCLDSLILVSVKPYILNYIEKAGVKVWGNELNKARLFRDTALALQTKYTLGKDTIINKAFADLNTKLKNQNCRNMLDDYNENFRTASIFISQNKYAEADDCLDKCIADSKQNTDCNIQNSLAVLNKEKYLEVALFQKNFKKSDSLASIGKYYEAINKYFECEKYYKSHNIFPFGLTFLSLSEHVIESKDNNYIFNCANYFLDHNDYPSVLIYLEILRGKNYQQTLTASIQESLASKLASSDFKNNAKQKPTALINKYTNGNTWYDCFKEAYKKNWKELKKKK